jgi:hypothetical protein
MIGQYLPNNNEIATVAFRQNFCQLNSPKSTATIRIDSLRMQLINKMAHLQITSLDDAATSLDTH